ncbi:MAG: BatA domain-containing protein [Nitrospirae bacterium]|nr:BatA domain-containing protein [Nitrospirota bacterium]
MEILNPGALWFLLALPVLALFHLLAPWHRTLHVSSLHLWGESREAGDRSFRWRRFYTNPQFLLQSLAILFLTSALSDPMVEISGKSSARRVLILDTSASMKAVEREGVRIDLARREALKILEQWKNGKIMVLSAGEVPRVRFSGDSREREKAAWAIREIRAGDTLGRLESAVQTGLEWKGNRGEVVLLTDGASPETLRIRRNHPEVIIVPLGRTDRNVAIVSLELREHPPGVSALVRNMGRGEEDIRVEALRDEESLGEESLSLQPGETVPVYFRLPPDMESGPPFSRDPGEDGVIEVRLHGEDALATDNRFWVPWPRPERTALLLVTPGNPFLERILKANPLWQVTVTAPEAYERTSGIGDGFDVVVFDRCPLTAVGSSDSGGRGGVFYLAPRGRTAVSGSEGEEIRIADWREDHPVMRFVEPASLRIRKAAVLTPPPWAEVLLEGRRFPEWNPRSTGLASGKEIPGVFPLIYGEESSRGRILVMGFDPSDSDFPEGSSFPIFLLNAVRWLQEKDRGEQIPAGSVYRRRVFPPQEAKEYRVVNPEGLEERVKPSGGIFRYENTETAGVYRVAESVGEGGVRRFAANVPSDEAAIGPLELPETIPAERGANTGNETPWKIFLWKPATVLALGVILAEWSLRRRGRERIRHGIVHRHRP